MDGYSTTQAAINLGGFMVGPDVLTVAIAPYGQLNQAGTIQVGLSSDLRVTGTDGAPATLNNGGEVDLVGGSVRISADLVGTGTIAFLPGRGGSTDFATLDGSVAPTQHLSFSSDAFASLRLNDPSAFRGIIDGFDAPFESEIGRAGSISGLLASWPGDPVADVVPLRLAAALHALVLSEAAPELAALYPGAAKGTEVAAVWRTALSAIEANHAFVEGLLASPPQTNEVGRSAVLLGGFLETAWATGGKPMRLFEVGASAGLNQFWDQYRYDLGEAAHWGDASSPVTVRAEWNVPLPPLDAPVAVAERAASDSAPVDLEDPEARLRLRAYVWADQPARMALLDAAVALARRRRLRVEQGEAGAWVAERLRGRVEGQATVLFHSIAWEYFPDATKAQVRDAVEAAGQRADAAAPFAWLRLEPSAGSGPGGGQPELRLTLWPGGHDGCLARAHTHGPPVHWLGGDTTDE